MELLRQRAIVYIIDEFRVSRVCSACVQLTLRPLQTADGSRPHALRVCHHCHNVWNRDVNAAHNMALLLRAELEGRERPAALRRPGWAAHAAEAVAELHVQV